MTTTVKTPVDDTVLVEVLELIEAKMETPAVPETVQKESQCEFATRWVGNLANMLTRTVNEERVPWSTRLGQNNPHREAVIGLEALLLTLQSELEDSRFSFQEIAQSAREACDQAKSIRDEMAAHAAARSGQRQPVAQHKEPTMSGPKPESRARKAERSLRDQQLRSSMKGTGGGGAPRHGSGAKSKKG